MGYRIGLLKCSMFSKSLISILKCNWKDFPDIFNMIYCFCVKMTNGVTPWEQTPSQTMTLWGHFCFTLIPSFLSASSRLGAQSFHWKIRCVLVSSLRKLWPIQLTNFFRLFWFNSHLVGIEFQIVFQYRCTLDLDML